MSELRLWMNANRESSLRQANVAALCCKQNLAIFTYISSIYHIDK